MVPRLRFQSVSKVRFKGALIEKLRFLSAFGKFEPALELQLRVGRLRESKGEREDEFLSKIPNFKNQIPFQGTKVADSLAVVWADPVLFENLSVRGAVAFTDFDVVYTKVTLVVNLEHFNLFIYVQISILYELFLKGFLK